MYLAPLQSDWLYASITAVSSRHCQVFVNTVGAIPRQQCVWPLKWSPLAKTIVYSCIFFPINKSQKLMLSLHSCVLLLCPCTQLVCLIVSDTVHTSKKLQYIFTFTCFVSLSRKEAIILASGHCHTHTDTHTYTNTFTLKHVNDLSLQCNVLPLKGFVRHIARTDKLATYIYILVQWAVIGRIACICNRQHSNNEVGGKWGWPIDVIPIYSSTCSEFQTELRECCTFSWSWCTHSPWSSSPSTCLTCPPRVLPPSPCCGLSSSSG